MRFPPNVPSKLSVIVPQESMLVRVSTARQETAAIQHFDYGARLAC